MAELVRYPMPRVLASLDPAKNHVIEASAGTGKTYLLEHRVVDLLLRGHLELPQILVVTFTEKATRELQVRVRALLIAIAQSNEHRAAPDEPHWRIDDAARSRLAGAIASFDRAAIHTIHGFCQGVLTDNAFASRRLFEQQQVTDSVAFERAFLDCVRSELATDPVHRRYLRAWLQVKSLSDLETLLYRCAAKLGETSELVPPFSSETLHAAASAASAEVPDLSAGDAVFRRALKELKVPTGTINALLKRLSQLRALLDEYSSTSPPDELLLLERLNASEVLLYLLKKLPAGGNLAALRQACEGLAAAAVPLQAAVAQQFLPVVRARLRAHKDSRGQFDFGDMLTLVWRALEGPSGQELAQRLRSRYRCALIDEFQDTDPIQWAIFRRLFLEARGAQLTLIGDPKQAIYGFRGADVFTYLQATREVLERGGRRTHLTDNWRSTAGVVAAYNHIFANDPQSFFSGGIRYDHPVTAAAPLGAGIAATGEATPAVLLCLESAEKKPTAPRLKAALVNAIASEIAALLGEEGLCVGPPGAMQPVQPSDIFVLTRSVAESHDVIAALRAAGIPCAIYKQEGLWQTNEAREVRDVLRAIAELGDPAVRLAAWNTRFFDVPLSMLPRVAEVADDHPLLQRLHDWRALADAMEYPSLLAQILADSRIIERLLLLDGSERAITNILHLFELILEETMRTRCDLGELVMRLQRRIDGLEQDTLDTTGIQRLESDRAAVQVMTVHRAKGLEAAVVFIYGGINSSNDSLNVFHDEAGRRMVHAGKASDEVKAHIASESRGEDERLMYVALTRAKARLYLPVPPSCSGAYACIHRRVVPIADALAASPPDAALAKLFERRRVDVDARRTRNAPDRSLAGWLPSTLPAPAPSKAFYERMRSERAGFVITSYTRLKHEQRQSDALLTAPAAFAERLGGGAASAHELPGGAAVGVFLHEVLEHIPLAAARDSSLEAFRAHPDVAALVSEAMRRHQQEPAHRGHAEELVWHALTSPIDCGTLRLPPLCHHQRLLRETEFLFAIAPAGQQGYVKGFIDVLFESDERIYLLDYKSDVLESWETSAIEAHVASSYTLQALVYSLALVRTLDVTDESDYERRCGGLIFQFLRGGPRCHIERPTWRGLLEASERLARGDTL